MTCAAGPGTYDIRRRHRGRVTELLCGACRRWGRGECARRQAEAVLASLAGPKTGPGKRH